MDVHTSFFVGVVTKLRSWCSELKVKKKKHYILITYQCTTFQYTQQLKHLLNNAASLAEQRHLKLVDTGEVRPLFLVSNPPSPPQMARCLKFPSPLLHRWPSVSNSPIPSTDGPLSQIPPSPPSHMARCLKFPSPLLHRWLSVSNSPIPSFTDGPLSQMPPSPPIYTKPGISTDEHTAYVRPVPSTNTFHFL